MRFDHLKSLYLSGGVFVILLVTGFLLSERKLLWTDELYTQQAVIDTRSYSDILTSRTPEGNKNPLFYVMQKVVSNIYSYHMPVYFSGDFYRTRDIPSQVIMRIPSNIYMSLALALLFYFFTRFFSILAAVYALSVALVSPMVWMYWAEARPYPLWFLLTTVQLVLLCCPFIAPKIKTTNKLFLTHIFLALTASASIFQISIAVLVLWRRGGVSIKKLALIWALPMGIAGAYYFISKVFKIKTYMFFPNLFDGVMPERLFVYVVYALIAWVLPEKYKRSSNNTFFLPIFFLFFTSVCFLLSMNLYTKNSDFGFFSRYLIYLAPADIMMFSLASVDLRRWSRQNFWICLNVSIFLGGLVIVRGLMTYRDILAAATYLHSPS